MYRLLPWKDDKGNTGGFRILETRFVQAGVSVFKPSFDSISTLFPGSSKVHGVFRSGTGNALS